MSCQECESILDICDGCLRNEYQCAKKELAKYKQAFEVLKKANDFYCDKDMWHFVKDGDFKCRINYDDVTPYYLENPKSYSCGGKRAREAAIKAEEILK